VLVTPGSRGQEKLWKRQISTSPVWCFCPGSPSFSLSSHATLLITEAATPGRGIDRESGSMRISAASPHKSLPGAGLCFPKLWGGGRAGDPDATSASGLVVSCPLTHWSISPPHSRSCGSIASTASPFPGNLGEIKWPFLGVCRCERQAPGAFIAAALLPRSDPGRSLWLMVSAPLPMVTSLCGLPGSNTPKIKKKNQNR